MYLYKIYKAMTIDLHLTKYTWNNALITEVCKGDFMIVKSYPKSLRYGKFIAHILTQKVVLSSNNIRFSYLHHRQTKLQWQQFLLKSP